MVGGDILIVIPARGGSKGIPLKNLAKVGGKTLIERVANVVNKLTIPKKVIVSTDHQAIADEAVRVGLEVPFWRPEELSGPIVSDVDVLIHALNSLETAEKTFEFILMLQPTSPLRQLHHITETIALLTSGGYDSVLTVSETDSKSHPLKQLCVLDNKLEYYDRAGEKIIARQQLTPVYHRNGAAYGMTRDCLLNQKTTIGKNCGAVIVDEPLANIDTPLDLALANWLLDNQSFGFSS